MRRYKWLFFDADGTLFDYERAEAAALAQAFQRCDLPFKTDHLTAYRGFNRDLWLTLEKGLITPDALKVRRFELLFEAMGLAHSATEFSAIYLDCLAGRSELMDGAREMVEALRPKYRMAVLTNGLQAVQRPRLARSPIREHISDLVISEEIGWAKPAKEFFDIALARLDHPAKREILMIGDNWVSDIQGASRYGLDTCWFNPRRQRRPDDPAITLEIASWQELTEWLR